MKLLNEAMLLLAMHPTTLFVGQSVAYPGTSMFDDLAGIPPQYRIEWPVAEDLQIGACIGLSLQGYLPVAIIPRIDFLLRAADQLVNHLDKLVEMSNGQFLPQVIIRTRVGQTWPLNAGPQHSQNHTEAFRRMLTTVRVREITRCEDIMPEYQDALAADRSTLIVENLAC